MKKIYFLLMCVVLPSLYYGSPVMAEPLCMKESRSEEEINICQHAVAKELELQIGDMEKLVRTHFKSPQIERFDEAQTRWQQMTEKDCEIEANFYEGAAIYPAIQSECLQRHYQERLQTLKKYTCPEYNLGNGCESTGEVTAPAVSPSDETGVKNSDNVQQIKNTKRFR